MTPHVKPVLDCQRTAIKAEEGSHGRTQRRRGGEYVALVPLRGTELATGDEEFKEVEKEIKVHWLV